jgi:hypothetical protein
MCNLGKNTTTQKADSATPAQFRLNDCISAALIAENAHGLHFSARARAGKTVSRENRRGLYL